MGLGFKKTLMSEKEMIEVSSLIFVKMAEEGTLDDITISEHPSLFPTWTPNWTGKAGTIVMRDGKLYRSIHHIKDTSQNTDPSEAPSMWTAISDPTEEFPEWVQPIGAHDAYTEGDKVSHTDKHWVSIAEGNVWQPGVYGWEEVE